jgi:hypothetical protein
MHLAPVQVGYSEQLTSVCKRARQYHSNSYQLWLLLASLQHNWREASQELLRGIACLARPAMQQAAQAAAAQLEQAASAETQADAAADAQSTGAGQDEAAGPADEASRQEGLLAAGAAEGTAMEADVASQPDEQAAAGSAVTQQQELPGQQGQPQADGMRSACVLDLALRLLQTWATSGSSSWADLFLRRLRQLATSTADASTLLHPPGAQQAWESSSVSSDEVDAAAQRALLLQLSRRPQDACVLWLSGGCQMHPACAACRPRASWTHAWMRSGALASWYTT